MPEDMTNIEMYAIQMSLSEGIIRDAFPKLSRLLNTVSHRKTMALALDDYIKTVSSGRNTHDNRYIAFEIAKRYGSVDWHDLVGIIDAAIKKGIIDARFAA